jgi:hypothetical protein
MSWCRSLLVAGVAVALASPAAAGIFKRGPKPNPSDRVPQLIATVKTDKDEANRATAAEELRQYDPKAFPEIVPVLIDVLLNDAKPTVRAEAAQSLGKMRPVCPEAGWALEQAVSKDSSMRVRLQARSALLHYHWAGYRSPKLDEPPQMQSKEPPLAGAPAKGPALGGGPPPVKTTNPIAPATGQLRPAPFPVVPPRPPLITGEPPLLEPPPAAPIDHGPELLPPE